MKVFRLVACTLSIGMVAGVCGFGARHNTPSACVSLIFTAAPQYDELAALRGRERFPRGAQLLLHQSGTTAPLIEGFAATADANVSFDGTHVLFAGKQELSEPWAIWEFTFADRSVRKVMGGAEDLIRPLYLPAEQVVYARRVNGRFQIEVAELDGSSATVLSHVGSSAVPADVLADGRILFESTYPLGTAVERGGLPELYLMYSDGSGVESYRCDHGAARWGGKQLASGDVIFTHGARLARFSSPYAVERAVMLPAAQYAGGLAETGSGDWIVSARAEGADHFALQRYARGAALLQPFITQSGADLVEPVLLAARNRPKHHPSALHPWDYANLLALNARLSRDGSLMGQPASVRVERLDASGRVVALGAAPVEADGSFFVKVPGDTPIRFSVLDAQGKTLRSERGWFWIRSGEQRICVGCHTGPERAAENKFPAVLSHTTTPLDLTGSSHQAAAGGR